MTEATQAVDTTAGVSEASFYEIAAVIVRGWRLVFVVTALAAGVTITTLTLLPSTYTATASFVSQGTQDIGQGGFRNLAVQFGVSLAGATQTQLPQFYSDLIRSRPVLDAVIDAEYKGSGVNRPVRTIGFEVESADVTAENREDARQQLSRWIGVQITPKTGVLTISVKSTSRALSLAIANQIISEVNDFNTRTRRDQATAERAFTEERLALATGELRAAEAAVEAFLTENRQTSSSPRLQFELEKLRSVVSLKNQVVTSLATTLEDVRIREMRSTPVITVIESPYAAVLPDRRKRVTYGSLAAVAAAIVAMLGLLAKAAYDRSVMSMRADVVEFRALMSDHLAVLRSFVAWPSRRRHDR